MGTESHEKVAPLKVGEMLMLSVCTTTSVGKVEKIKGDEIELSLKIPIIALEKDNVGIARNINNHWRLIGYGEIIKK